MVQSNEWYRSVYGTQQWINLIEAMYKARINILEQVPIPAGELANLNKEIRPMESIDEEIVGGSIWGVNVIGGAGYDADVTNYLNNRKRIGGTLFEFTVAPIPIITEPIPVQYFTYNYTSEFGTFSISAESELIAYAAFQQWLKEKQAGILEPEPEPEPEPPALLSANVKISFTNPNIGGFSSSIPLGNIDELQGLSNASNDWKYILIGSSTIQPISTLSELIKNINDLLVQPDEPKPDKPDITITPNMVTQQLINFNIVNGRAVGSIKFVATNNFNPYYYGKNIVNIIQFKDPNGAKIGVVKENRLNFTETEIDEVISYDESMEANTRATVESFVWSSATQPTAFSKMGSWDISEAEPPKPLTTGFMSAGAAGAIAGLVLLGFIIDSKVGKR